MICMISTMKKFYFLSKSRSFCTVDSGLLQLNSDIDLVYSDLQGERFGISIERLLSIQQRIVLGLYVLSPVKVEFITRDSLVHFFFMKVSKCPDILIVQFPEEDDKVAVFSPTSKDDVWVYLALSVMLLLLMAACLKRVTEWKS